MLEANSQPQGHQHARRSSPTPPEGAHCILRQLIHRKSHDAMSPKCHGLRRWLSSMRRSSTRVSWSSLLSTNLARSARSPRTQLPIPTKCQEWLNPIPTKCLLTRIAWTNDFDKLAANSAIVVEVWCHNCFAIRKHKTREAKVELATVY